MDRRAAWVTLALTAAGCERRERSAEPPIQHAASPAPAPVDGGRRTVAARDLVAKLHPQKLDALALIREYGNDITLMGTVKRGSERNATCFVELDADGGNVLEVAFACSPKTRRWKSGDPVSMPCRFEPIGDRPPATVRKDGWEIAVGMTCDAG
jgi:hypothetical protein